MNTNILLNQVFSNAVPAAPAAPGTAGFEDVAFLMHADGTNGASNTPIRDSSQVNATFTKSATYTEIGQGSFTPFNPNGYSCFFVGSTYIDFPTGTFNYYGKKTTFEFWVCPVLADTNNSGRTAIISNQNASGVKGQVGVHLHRVTDYAMSVGLYSAQSGIDIESTATIPVGKWSHVVIQVDVTTPSVTNELIFYINGVREVKTINFAASTATDYSATSTCIGGNGYQSNYFQGYLSNLRIVQGSSYVYTGASLNVPVSKLSAIAGTKLLTFQDNRIKDNSAAPLTLTRTGTPTITAYSPFKSGLAYSAAAESGSLQFYAGSTSIITTSNLASYPATGDFTIEGWLYQRSRSSDGVVFHFVGSTRSYFRLGAQGSGYDTMEIGGVAASGLAPHFPLNEWNHFAIVRVGTTVTVYSNGKSILTLNVSGTQFSGLTSINFGNWSGATQPFIGYMAGIRYSKVARYTSNFAVPTAPFAPDASTYLLLKGENGAVIDNSRSMSFSTGYSSASSTISTAVKKFGTGSLRTGAATGAYLASPNMPQYRFRKADFTVEFWAYSQVAFSSQGSVGFVGQKASDPTSGWVIYKNTQTNTGGPTIRLAGGTTASDYYAGATVGTQVWEHWAVTRQNGTLRWFKNGVLTATYNNVTGDINDTTGNFYVGYSQTWNDLFNGYIDELRITPGVARYTANFDVQTAPHSDI